VVVRRQVGEFSTRTARVVEELAQRQNRLSAFVARTFLDRQRRLEYRVAALERELERLRGELRAATPDAASDAAPAAAPDGPGAAEGPGGESV
jgi:hypothetical protein